MEQLRDYLTEKQMLEFVEKSKNTNLKLEEYYIEDKEHIYFVSSKGLYSQYYFDIEMALDGIKYADALVKRVENLILNNKWNDVFTNIAKQNRVELFIEYAEQIPEEDFFEIFLFVYQSSEYGFDQINEEILERIKKTNSKIQELKIKRIYRGINTKSNYIGISWTTDKKIAEFFANRFEKGKGKILSYEIDNDAIVYYDELGSEKEVLVLPSLIDKNKVEVVAINK